MLETCTDYSFFKGEFSYFLEFTFYYSEKSIGLPPEEMGGNPKLSLYDMYDYMMSVSLHIIIHKNYNI